jgi:hypothetical protein
MASKLKPQIGDICELKTPIGLAYAQYTHHTKNMGHLVRILPGTYSTRPDLALLAKQKELYFVFYALEYALRAKEAEIVLNEEVPEWAKKYPLMRKAGGLTDAEGRTLNWTIAPADKLSTVVDLHEALQVRGLTPEQRTLSVYALSPHTALARDIARGWLPERDEELSLLARKAKKASTPKSETETKLEHFLYFPKQTQAKEAARRIEARGWRVEVRRGADGVNWLVLAKQPVSTSDDVEKTRSELERLAGELHGEYDGWGAAI